MFKLPTYDQVLGLRPVEDDIAFSPIRTDFARITKGYERGVFILDDSNSPYFIVDTQGQGQNLSRKNLYGIRPAINFDEIKDKCTIIKKNGDFLLVSYGEYPREELYETGIFSKELIPTGKEYHFDDVFFKSWYEHLALPGHFNSDSVVNGPILEYYYNGKKIVKVDYKGNDNVMYFKVEPVEFIVDTKNNIAITRDIIIFGVYPHKAVNFVTKSFAQDIIPSKNGQEKQEEKSGNYRNFEIKSIIFEIEEVLDIHPGKEEIKKEIDRLKKEYNSKIEYLQNHKEDSLLTFENIDRDYLYNKLKSDLNDILIKVRLETQDIKKYKDMLTLLEEWETMLEFPNKKQDEYNNSISQDLYKLVSIVLPFLDEQEEYDKLKNMIDSEKKKILDYISNKNKNGYKDIEDFEYQFRAQLQDYLANISKKVKSKDLLNEILLSYIRIVNNETFEINNKYFKKYLDEIKKIYDYIIDNGEQSEREAAHFLMISDFYDRNKNMIEIMADVRERFMKLYSIELDIKEGKKFDGYKLDV